MNSELILKSDILDILFENRNKNYGAYSLRKSYHSQVRKALAGMMVVAIVLYGLSMMQDSSGKVVTTVWEIPQTKLAKAEQKKPEIKKPEQPKAETPRKKESAVTAQQLFINKLKIVPETDKTDSIRPLDDKLAFGNINTVTPGSVPAVVEPVSTVSVTESSTFAPKKREPLDGSEVEVMPSFPGGTEALIAFLQRHLNNPEPMNPDESVIVKASFVVGYDGKLQGFKIIQDGGDVFNKEVMRVLKKMPDWVPGKAKGENVAVYYTIPVKFTGQD